MISLNSDLVRLSMQEDGSAVAIDDLVRKTRWTLDESTRLAARSIGRFETPAWTASAVARPDAPVRTLGPGEARPEGADAIVAVHDGPAGRLKLRWTVERDRVRIAAEPEAGDGGAAALTLPGAFRPEGGWSAAIPLGQGVLHTGAGPAFHRPLTISGHGDGYTLSVFGALADRGGLAVIAETAQDASVHWEKTADGRVDLAWIQHPSLGRLGYSRECVIVPVDPTVTAVCKAFRRHEIAAGRFRTWDEKIAQRPALDRLFGAAVVFLGYLQDRDLDYPAAFRRLRGMGVDRAYVLPVRMATTLDLGEAMGGPPADLRAHVPLLHELGWLAGSFLYLTDGPAGDGEGLRHDSRGRPMLKWQIEDRQWWALGAAERARWARALLDSGHEGLDAVHFDVLTCTRFQEDWNSAARADARSEGAAIRDLLADAGGRGLIVASEGFLDRMTPWYDIGSTKFSHVVGPGEYATVPMTMLVYHDSAIHTWWEVDNYGNPEHRSQFGRGYPSRLWWGGGYARRQAAIDALMGTPPDIFPFGMQYNYVPHAHPRTYAYRPSLDSPAVVESIECAKPVMALNRRIGRLELVDHRLYGPDGAVQQTVFADGTRVLANFAEVPLEGPDGEILPPWSWISR